MPRKWNQSNVQVPPVTSVLQLHLHSCTHQSSERGLIQRRVTFKRHVYWCWAQPRAEGSVGASCCDLFAWTPARREPVCCLLLLRLNALCSKLLCSKPECLTWLTHKFVPRLKTACFYPTFVSSPAMTTINWPTLTSRETLAAFWKENSHWKV